MGPTKMKCVVQRKRFFSKKCIFGRFTANWPFGLLLHLFFPAIKNKCSENESNSFLQKNYLLFYGQVQKMPFRPIGGLGCYCIYFFWASKTNAQKMKVIHFYKRI